VKTAFTEIREMHEKDRERFRVKIDEKEILKDSVDFLRKEFGADFIIEDASSPSYDPKGRSKLSKPLRPALYVE